MNAVLVILDSLRKDHIGAYGSDRVRTPNLDAFAGESFRFTRAYPESLPTICARRAIHTGLRTFPFRNRVELPGETFQPAGWQPIPEDQVTLSETLVAQGYNTALYSDTQPMFHPSMNFQRGFRVFDWIRGQERDRYRPKSMAPEDVVERNTVPGNDEAMVSKVQQYVANTRDRERGGGLLRPARLRQGDGVHGALRGGPAVLARARLLRPARALGPARGVREPLLQRLRRARPHRPQLRRLGVDRRRRAREDARPLRRRGHDGGPLVRALSWTAWRRRAASTTPRSSSSPTTGSPSGSTASRASPSTRSGPSSRTYRS